MAAEGGGSEASHSPSDSGRSTPIKRPSRRQVDDDHFRPDKNFRRYASNVERALSLFDTALQEWADYISFLGRLLKAIQSHPPAVDILPHNAEVAKRLSQCLSSSLPSGVHQKAIEVYSYVFSLIGKQRLSRDLQIYLPGLTPVLSFAALSVRPYFLALIETHLLPLEASALRPALKAILLGLLPGLEEETSEDFDRTLQIFDSLKFAVNSTRHDQISTENVTGDEYFWQCLFLSVVTSPSRRLGGLNFLTKRLPSLAAQSTSSNERNEKISNIPSLSVDIETLISPEPGLLIRCFIVGLGDDQLLIQRGFLDLLVSRLPLNSSILINRANAIDRQRLVAAATGVVARRDMSLNRRLWSWFLGMASVDNVPGSNDILSPPEENPDPLNGHSSSNDSYFTRYGVRSLVEAMLSMFVNDAPNSVARARPFRICLSLMDRAEIGAAIAPDLFLAAMKSLASYKDVSTEEEFGDVLRSASGFFDSVESKLIWHQLQILVTTALTTESTGNQERLEKLNLATFIITTFNVREEDMLVVHMPLLFITVAALVNKYESENSGEPQNISQEVLEQALGIADLLGKALPNGIFLGPRISPQSPANVEPVEMLKAPQTFSRIQQYYHQGTELSKQTRPPFAIYEATDLVVEQTLQLLVRSLHSGPPTRTKGLRSRLLVAILSNVGNQKDAYGETLFQHLKTALYSSSSELITGQNVPFTTISAIIMILAQFLPPRTKTVRKHASELLVPLIRALWSLLSPSTPRHHVEAVRYLWQLHDLSMADGLVEACVSSFIGALKSRGADVTSRTESARRFAVLWTHTANISQATSRKSQGATGRSISTMSEHGRLPESRELIPLLHRPLLLLLDALSETDIEPRNFTTDWLKALPEVDSILEFLMTRLLAIVSIQTPALANESEDDGMTVRKRNQDTSQECLNYLQHCLNFVSLPSDNILLALSREITTESEKETGTLTVRAALSQVCFQVLQKHNSWEDPETFRVSIEIQTTACAILRTLLQGPDSIVLKDFSYEDRFIALLRDSVNRNPVSHSLQLAFMEVILAALDLRQRKLSIPQKPGHRRASSTEAFKSIARLTLNTGSHESLDRTATLPAPPPHLVACIQEGISSQASHNIIENWVNFLIETLPYLSNGLFRVLIPLVECLCGNIGQTLEALQQTFSNDSDESAGSPEKVIYSLLTALDFLLVSAHGRLALEEQKGASTKTPEQQQGFFGNVVSGVFSSEFPKGRTATANTRLTVLLSFQDAIQKCLALCAWGSRRYRELHSDSTSAASLGYLSQRLRNKARRLLDRIFTLELLESLETFVVQWTASTYGSNPTTPSVMMRILHVLDATKPKAIISAAFHAIYSRTNPEALDPGRISTLTADLSDIDLITFLLEYTRSLDDDTMDEIWTDCMTFMKDVLANPLPHRQILPGLIMFVPMLTEKMENTNFGEQRKTRRELADFFMRLLSASFTTRSLGSTQGTQDSNSRTQTSQANGLLPEASLRRMLRASDITEVVSSVVPSLHLTLTESERLSNAASNISTSLISPIIHSRSFPDIVKMSTLELLYNLTRLAPASKIWKKDVADALNNPKFFSSSLSLVDEKWLQIFRQWCIGDNTRIPEILTRIMAPTSAGIMFGVGASSARLEADKKTQLNLRRLAILILAADDDWAVPHIPGLEERIVELFAATPTSSPSSLTRAEIFMLIRAMLLKISSIHLSPIWPVVNSELQKAIASTLPRNPHYETYQTNSLLQACKLLDLLVAISPDEFQLHQWLFITDTIDAVYVPNNWEPIALIDDLADELGFDGPMQSPKHHTTGSATVGVDAGLRKPLLLNISEDLSITSKDDIIRKVLRPFYTQLSFQSFEAAYEMTAPDLKACKDALLKDILDDATFVT